MYMHISKHVHGTYQVIIGLNISASDWYWLSNGFPKFQVESGLLRPSALRLFLLGNVMDKNGGSESTQGTEL